MSLDVHGPARVLRNLCATLILVLLFTSIVLALAEASPWAAYRNLIAGAFGSGSKVARVFTVWVPLTLCACGLLYTFRIDLWNIGVEGQVVAGAIGATWALRSGLGSASPAAALLLAVAAGAAAGSVWAFLAGVLKTRGGVNEIFAGLGLNFVAQGVVLWLIFGPWRRPGVASMSGTEPFPPELWLTTLSGGVSWGRLSPVAAALALIAVLGTGYLLSRTKIGLCLRAVGRNPRASLLFGLSPDRYMLLAMALAGGLAGLAGTVQVTAVYHRLIPSISSNYGYLALLVAMLANYRLWAVPGIAFFFAALNVGSVQLPMVLELDSSLSGVIQGGLVLATLFVHGWGRRNRVAQGG